MLPLFLGRMYMHKRNIWAKLALHKKGCSDILPIRQCIGTQ